jgi:sulfoxide reductase heme-binding subunit YedZ
MTPSKLPRLLNAPIFFWCLLALPALVILGGYARDTLSYGEVIHASGEWSARFLLLTLAATPASLLFPTARFAQGWLARRRHLGVATFLYALLHTLVYVARKADIGLILHEGSDIELWTGWLALVLFGLLALTSNDASLRALKAGWKKLHRLVYAGALLTFAHWLLAAFDRTEAFIYAGIFVGIKVLHIALSLRRRIEG